MREEVQILEWNTRLVPRALGVIYISYVGDFKSSVHKAGISNPDQPMGKLFVTLSYSGKTLRRCSGGNESVGVRLKVAIPLVIYFLLFLKIN
jgi:hypothetical protein